ncbi:unnamed protein product, partial [Rhizoctonia solani]
MSELQSTHIAEERPIVESYIVTLKEATNTERHLKWMDKLWIGMKVIDPVSAMWERTLSDLIRGLRANKGDESQFIAKAVDEIRTEVKSKD